MPRRFWLFKSEPSCYSIRDLENTAAGTDCWDGVRNYQARNLLRDEIQVGDGVLFYHSNIPDPAVVGIAVVTRAGYPDHTAQDPDSDHFDPRSSFEKPIWYMVDIQYVASFRRPVNREVLRQHPVLCGMDVLKRGNRLSIQPVSRRQWLALCDLGGVKDEKVVAGRDRRAEPNSARDIL